VCFFVMITIVACTCALLVFLLPLFSSSFSTALTSFFAAVLRRFILYRQNEKCQIIVKAAISVFL